MVLHGAISPRQCHHAQHRVWPACETERVVKRLQFAATEERRRNDDGWNRHDVASIWAHPATASLLANRPFLSSAFAKRDRAIGWCECPRWWQSLTPTSWHACACVCAT